MRFSFSATMPAADKEEEATAAIGAGGGDLEIVDGLVEFRLFMSRANFVGENLYGNASQIRFGVRKLREYAMYFNGGKKRNGE